MFHIPDPGHPFPAFYDFPHPAGIRAGAAGPGENMPASSGLVG